MSQRLLKLGASHLVSKIKSKRYLAGLDRKHKGKYEFPRERKHMAGMNRVRRKLGTA